MQSILFEKYKEPERPISKKELAVLYKKYLKQLKLSNIETYHTSTRHFYLLKQNGKKETSAKEIIEKKQLKYPSVRNVGSCSVTWKLKHTPEELKPLARNIIQEYEDVFKHKNIYNFENITHYEIELSRIFYIWLYYEKYDTEQTNTEQKNTEQTR